MVPQHNIISISNNNTQSVVQLLQQQQQFQQYSEQEEYLETDDIEGEEIENGFIILKQEEVDDLDLQEIFLTQQEQQQEFTIMDNNYSSDNCNNNSKVPVVFGSQLIDKNSVTPYSDATQVGDIFIFDKLCVIELL